MINVTIYKQSDYPVAASEIKKSVVATLEKQGIVSDCVVEVALIGEGKMEELNKTYYKDEEYLHPIFTFPENETSKKGEPFVFPPDGKIHLGEIVISYPQAVERARETGRLIKDIVCELAQHGALHLVGVHHE